MVDVTQTAAKQNHPFTFIAGERMFLISQLQITFPSHDSHHRVLDKLDDFTKLQKAALLSVKNNDPEFAITMKQHKQRIQSFRKMALKQLKPNKIVKLVGLKKKEWNGKKAKIIGKRVLKSDMIKWPVQLDDSKDKALIKQSNLQKLD